MRRILGLAMTVALVSALSAPVAYGADRPSGPVTTEVEDAVLALGPGETLTVMVTLEARAQFEDVRGLSRKDKPAAVVAALQATAEASQQPLLALLERLEESGDVAAFESFWIVNGAQVTATSQGIEAIAALPSVATIDLPAEVEEAGSYDPAATELNLDLVGAPGAWGQGLTGEGVVVATLDTGVYPHPDVAGSYRGGTNSWFDPYGEHSLPYDANGHGTATMSVIVGRDNGGTAIGVAPDATWISAKIFADSGQATEAAIHESFQWILDPDGDPATQDTPDIVSNSWSVTTPGCDTSFEQDLAALVAAEIVPIFAAGNAGPGPSSSRSPGNLPEAFSVGAVDDYDNVYTGSSRGPSACVDDVQFPDLAAPGVSIKAADNNTSSYWYPTGTSMAAPHVAGALALILEDRPGLTEGQQVALLTSGAVDLGETGPDDVFGYGRLDVGGSLATETPNIPPVAVFSVGKGKRGALTFDASASYDPDGVIVAYDWDFGDGSSASGMIASHTYSTSGSFLVVLTVLDSRGASSTADAEVTIGSKGGGGSSGGSGGHGGGNKPPK